MYFTGYIEEWLRYDNCNLHKSRIRLLDEHEAHTPSLVLRSVMQEKDKFWTRTWLQNSYSIHRWIAFMEGGS